MIRIIHIKCIHIMGGMEFSMDKIKLNGRLVIIRGKDGNLLLRQD